MDTLYVAWQQPDSKEWIPVAKLERANNKYRFSYTRGAIRARDFPAIGRMGKIRGIYESETLFPFFANRVISKSRPEYKHYLKWLNLAEMTEDPMSILSLTGGIRGTDDIELFPPPSINSRGQYSIEFFVRGIRHLPKETINLINSLGVGQRLFLMQDFQNQNDQFALALRTASPAVFVGYCPKYYARDLTTLLSSENSCLDARIKSVNSDAPLSMRLLCTVTASLTDEKFRFHNGPDFEPVGDELPEILENLSLDF